MCRHITLQNLYNQISGGKFILFNIKSHTKYTLEAKYTQK